MLSTHTVVVVVVPLGFECNVQQISYRLSRFPHNEAHEIHIYMHNTRAHTIQLAYYSLPDSMQVEFSERDSSTQMPLESKQIKVRSVQGIAVL